MYQTIFQNEHFIIVDKEANTLSVAARTGEEDKRPCLLHQLSKDLNQKILAVHRLDYEVSGLIMYALNPKAQSIGNAWFEKKEIKKTYEAKTTTEMPFNQEYKNKFNWQCLLLRGKKRAYISPHGKKAITEGQCINEQSDGIYQWHLSPITGRSHQLRFELFRHDHFIIGDELYGSKKKFEKGIALRAFQIDFSNCKNHLDFGLPSIIKISGL
jgi:tRNA pseudouridine32 synthase/23S rRNA pseudouridine746 synthase